MLKQIILIGIISSNVYSGNLSALIGGGGGSSNNGFSNCETLKISPTTSSSSTITCTTGKSIRSHSFTCSTAARGSSYATECGVTDMTKTSLTGRGGYYDSGDRSLFSASILCCDD